MKFFFVLLAAVVITVSGKASSPSAPVSAKVLAAFATEFKNVSDVKWTSTAGLQVATFKLNNEAVSAWFNEDGVLEAVQRFVTNSQMTVLAARAVESIAADAIIKSITEVSKQSELFYLVKADNEKATVIYKVFSDGSTERFKKIKK
jgi:hypothetical protein